MSISALIRSAAEPAALEQALTLLRGGDVVAHPTDTVYGLAADSGNPDAIERLFEVKERPREKAIPLLLADAGDLPRVARTLPASAYELAERYWPGGLTLVVPAAEWLPSVLTAGTAFGRTVAVRLPDHAVPRMLARRLGRPLAATSANISGHSSPVTAQEVAEQLGDRIPLILDGGPAPGGIASTVVDLTQSPPRILREGPIGREELASLLTSPC